MAQRVNDSIGSGTACVGPGTLRQIQLLVNTSGKASKGGIHLDPFSHGRQGWTSGLLNSAGSRLADTAFWK